MCLFKLNLKKQKRFINGSYNRNINFISNHLQCLNRIIDEYGKSLLFLGDFKVNTNEKCMEGSCNLNDLPSCVTKWTCLTNQPHYFQQSNVFQSALSDFQLLMVTEFKWVTQALPSKIVSYQNHQNFGNEKFRVDVCKFGFNTCDLEGFKNTIFRIFNNHVPIKRKYICVNAPFMTEEL